MKKFLGLDVGSSTVKAIIIDANKNIIYKESINHYGNPIYISLHLLEKLNNKFDNIVMLLSGSNSNLIANDKYIKGEIPTLQNGVSLLFPKAKSLIEIGSQNARYITNIGNNTPPQFAINENCAGGTGSFFEDQMQRLGLLTKDYSNIIEGATNIPRLSGRCSVFAKTDIIHRQQEGVSTEDILLGLCYATIKNLKATIIRNLPIEKPIVLGGGIVKNSGVIKAVKDIFELSNEDLLISMDNEFIQAIGTAKMASEETETISLSKCLEELKTLRKKSADHSVRRLKPLKLAAEFNLSDPKCIHIEKPTICSLGIDIGSTSTNLVLINENQEIVDTQYLRTKGMPIEVVKDGLLAIFNKYNDKIIINSVGVTGSGRYLIGELVGADSIKDEITAQAKSAVFVNINTDTVFEIGGQDSKYIQIENGTIKDFQMNKICAAGTGSFIEEQASRLQVNLSDFGKIALEAQNPVDLGERCTVFIESNINACLSKGVEVADLLAGLCHSVIHNYLVKVVANKKIGENIILQGGVCYNPAIVSAFKAVFGDRATVSPYFSVSGAFGVALLAQEEIGEKKTTFLGFHLNKKLNKEASNLEGDVSRNIELFQKSKKLLLGDYTRTINFKKKTVGVPYVLVVHKFFPMIRNYFETLGYNILLSPETDENIIALSQKYAKAETCYPVKLIYGHMAWLAENKVDYIFLPSIHTMKHENSKVYHNYGCVYMQSAPKFVFEGMKLSEKGIELLNPVLSLDLGMDAMASEMIETGVSLGKAKPHCVAALLRGAMAVRKHTSELEKAGKNLLDSIEPTDKVLVIVTRNYGIDDPVLNMNIPYELLSRGHKVITISHLPAHDMDISSEYENLYWPFGQHIVSSSKLISNHPNLYAVYLTNHGCAPDSMISHLFQKEMGDKPYLNIEVDEHYSKVGVITRIEAFLNSLNSQPVVNAGKSDVYFNSYKKQEIKISNQCTKNMKIFLPNLYPYSQIISKQLNDIGYNTEVLPKTSNVSIGLGRKIATTKEYLSFISLAGDILLKEEQLTYKAQVIIPQTEGSEADGIYPRVIYNYLKENSNLQIVSKTIETLPFKEKNFDQIFLALLAGDIILAEEPKKQDALLNKILKEKLTLEMITNLAKKIIWTNKKRVLLVGDPYIIYNSTLYDNIFDKIENKNLIIQKMPLSEYLLFMWQKRAETNEEISIVNNLISHSQKIHKALGYSSVYCDDFQELRSTAEKTVGSFTGGNGAYRFAKHNSTKAEAIIDVASMYENTQTILSLFNKDKNTPFLSLNFEGTNDISAKVKLKSFCHYI